MVGVPVADVEVVGVVGDDDDDAVVKAILSLCVGESLVPLSEMTFVP